MEIFFLLLAAVGVGGFIYVFTRKGTLDLDGDGDVDLDDAVEATEMIVEEVVDLATLTKNELLEYAASRGVDIPKSWTKGKIVSVLVEIDNKN
jgi:hypothetical protein